MTPKASHDSPSSELWKDAPICLTAHATGLIPLTWGNKTRQAAMHPSPGETTTMLADRIQ